MAAKVEDKTTTPNVSSPPNYEFSLNMTGSTSWKHFVGSLDRFLKTAEDDAFAIEINHRFSVDIDTTVTFKLGRWDTEMCGFLVCSSTIPPSVCVGAQMYLRNPTTGTMGSFRWFHMGDGTTKSMCVRSIDFLQQHKLRDLWCTTVGVEVYMHLQWMTRQPTTSSALSSSSLSAPTTTLSSRLLHLMTENVVTDVILSLADGTEMRVHRLVLCQSPEFRARFTTFGKSDETKSATIDMTSYDTSAVRVLILSMYTSSPDVSSIDSWNGMSCLFQLSERHEQYAVMQAIMKKMCTRLDRQTLVDAMTLAQYDTSSVPSSTTDVLHGKRPDPPSSSESAAERISARFRAEIEMFASKHPRLVLECMANVLRNARESVLPTSDSCIVTASAVTNNTPERPKKRARESP